MLLAAAAPLAAAPAIAQAGFARGTTEATGHDHGDERSATAHQGSRRIGHSAMIGAGVPAVGGPNDLDDLLYPPRHCRTSRGGCGSTP